MNETMASALAFLENAEGFVREGHAWRRRRGDRFEAIDLFPESLDRAGDKVFIRVQLGVWPAG